MAINHTTLWTKIGKLIKQSNSLKALSDTTLPANVQEIVSTYGTSLTGTTVSQSAIEGIESSYRSLMNNVASIRLSILQFADNTIQDYDTILSQLAGLDSGDVGTVLRYLIEDMIDQLQTVERSVVTVGSVSTRNLSVGNGSVALTTVLDGFNAPIAGGFAHRRYAGRLSELANPSVTHVFTCTSDSYGQDTNNGASFDWSNTFFFGEASPFGDQPGRGPGLAVPPNGSIVSNGDFENFSADTPSSWTVTSGFGGTHLKQNQNGFSGYCLELVGDGGTNVAMFQYLGQVNTLRMYHCQVRLRASGVPTSGQLEIFVSGTNYSTATGTSSITVQASSLSSSWTLYQFYWLSPVDLAPNIRLELRTTRPISSGSSILVDNLFVTPVVYHAGVGVSMIPGSKPFAIGDIMKITVTNTEKVIQKFCRTHWNCQLPSQTPSSGESFAGALLVLGSLFTTTSNPTIPDTLAT